MREERPGDGPDTSFFAAVLNEMPGPLLVISPSGEPTYANKAFLSLTGHPFDPDADHEVFAHVHPEDREWIVEAFIDVAEAAKERDTLPDPPAWASIQFRLIDVHGQPLPVEVTGINRANHDLIGGLIYDVRPARRLDLMRQVLIGLAERSPVEPLLELVISTIALPPLDLDAAVLEPDEFGRFQPIVSTSDTLSRALRESGVVTPWNAPTAEPTFLDLRTLQDTAVRSILDSGYVHLWHMAVQSTVTAKSYRLVCCTDNETIPPIGTVSRLKRANELAEVILLSNHADAMLAHAATHDALTGLSNRSGFYDDMSRALDETPIAALYVDLDGLKPINDNHGHQVGDVVLQHVAERLRRVTRSHDLVARLGGDEFAIVLRGGGLAESIDLEIAEALASRLLIAVAEPIEVDDMTVSISASVGLVMAEEPMEVEALLQAADAAMYEAKRAGGNQQRLSVQRAS